MFDIKQPHQTPFFAPHIWVHLFGVGTLLRYSQGSLRAHLSPPKPTQADLVLFQTRDLNTVTA